MAKDLNDNKKNIIAPYDDAVIYDSIKGNRFESGMQGGIFSGFEFSVDNDKGKFYIRPGYAMLDGRQFQLDGAHEFDLLSLSGIKYCVVYVEINLQNVTNNHISLKLAYGADYPDVSSDNLIENKTGIGRMLLYKFIYLANNGFTNVEKMFYAYESGIVEHVRALDQNGKLNEREISKLLHYNADRWKNAQRATYADLGKSIGNTDDSQTIDDYLKLGSGMSLLQVSNGCWHVTGVDQKDAPEDGKYLNENNSYKFYYEGSNNCVPANCTVIGIIVTGYIQGTQYDLGFLGLGSGWRKLTTKQLFRGRYWVRFEDVSKYLKDEKFKIFSGDAWHKQRPFVVGPMDEELFGGLKTGVLLLTSPTIEIKFPLAYGAIMRFKDIDTNNPYLEVYINDNYRFKLDLTFRLLMIGGTSSPDKTEINPFSTLNPELEGGQK